MGTGICGACIREGGMFDRKARPQIRAIKLFREETQFLGLLQMLPFNLMKLSFSSIVKTIKYKNGSNEAVSTQIVF